MQGRELEKLQSKLERVRQTIGANEQDFRQFVRVLEGTAGKWEQEWKAFCDVSALKSVRQQLRVSATASTGYGRGSTDDDQGHHLGICQCSLPGMRGGRQCE